MTEPMVAHIVPAPFDPEDGIIGGAERYSFELARHMAERVPTRLITFGRDERTDAVGSLEVQRPARPPTCAASAPTRSPPDCGPRSRTRPWCIVISSTSSPAAWRRCSAGFGAAVCSRPISAAAASTSPATSPPTAGSTAICTSANTAGRCPATAEAARARVILGGVDVEKFSPARRTGRRRAVRRPPAAAQGHPRSDRRHRARTCRCASSGSAHGCRLSRHAARAGGGEVRDVPARHRRRRSWSRNTAAPLCVVLPSVYTTPDGRTTQRARAARTDAARRHGLRAAGDLHRRGQHAGGRRRRRDRVRRAAQRPWRAQPRDRRRCATSRGRAAAMGARGPRPCADDISDGSRSWIAASTRMQRSDRTTWHILTGEYPPDVGGVSDYTATVARRARHAGDDVHVWTSGTSGTRRGAVTVHRVFGSFTGRGLAAGARLLDAHPGNGRVLVQWVPHAFARRGVNLRFPLWLYVAQRAPRSAGRRHGARTVHAVRRIAAASGRGGGAARHDRNRAARGQPRLRRNPGLDRGVPSVRSAHAVRVDADSHRHPGDRHTPRRRTRFVARSPLPERRAADRMFWPCR